MSSTHVVLDLACSTPELAASFRDPLQPDASDVWSLAPLIDLVAAAWCAYGASAPFAFDLELAELPNADDVQSVRLELEQDTGQYSVCYRTLARPDDWLVSVSGQLVSTSVASFDTSECEVSWSDSQIECSDWLEVAQSIVARVSRDERWLCVEIAPAWRSSQLGDHCIAPQIVSVALRVQRTSRGMTGAPPVRRIGRVEIVRPRALPHELRARTDGSVECIDAHGHRIALLERIEYAGAARAVIDAARLNAVTREALGRSVALDDDLFELGVGSLDLLRLLNMVRERGWRVPPLDQFLSAPRLARFFDADESENDVSAFTLARICRREPLQTRAPQPLTAMQRALWLESQKPGQRRAYIEHAAWALRGPLDRERLAQAFAALARRAESCRTRITEVGGRLGQHVLDVDAVALQRCEDADGDVAAWLARECRREWSADEPLLRAQLWCVTRDHHVLLVSAHHAICDGASCARWLELLGIAYADSLPPSAASLQPRHLARWEELPPIDAALRASAQAWADELIARPGEHELPIDHARGRDAQRPAGRVHFSLSPASVERLELLARQTHQSLESLGLGLFRAALYRWTGQAELAISVVAAQRWSPLFTNSLGCFINAAPLVIEARGAMPLQELLLSCRSQLRVFSARQHVPFAHVLDVAPQLAGCVRGVGFSQRDRGTFALPDIELEPLVCEADAVKLELAAHWLRSADGLACCLEYDRSLFEPETVSAFARRHQRLLCTLDGSRLACELEALPWLDDSERAALIAQARGPVRAPSAIMAPELISRAMREHHASPALFDADSGRRWTHAQLEHAAGRLAARIADHGASCVAIYMSNTPQWVIAVLGAWRSGVWWVSVEPDQPRARSSAMLRAIATRCVVTLAEHAEHVRALELEPLLVDVDDGDAQPLTAASVQPDALAYGVFTSGTTGVPKLALASHRGLANKLSAQRETFALAPGTRVLRFASPGFDAALSELMLALAAAAELLIAPRAARHDGAHLQRWLRAETVEVAMLTPSVAHRLDPRQLPALHTLLAIGERCSRALVDAWAREGRRVWNLYGPAEATMWTTLARCEVDSEPTIGRAIANAAVYVLDPTLELVAPGRSGEICIAGDGVGPGYGNDAELTRMRFVPNPYAVGERLYRSGDRGRYRNDGQLEFLGRFDDEVKLRGRRIALGEIEAVLRERSGAEAAVIVHAADSEQAALIGFVAADVDVTTLRRELFSVLPPHAVPARLVPIASLPRSANGKLDRDALACLAAADHVPGAPLTDRTQQLVAAAMAEVLGLDAGAIGPDDDFTTLGGNSLSVLALSERLLHATDVSFPLAVLLSSPSVRELAARARGDASSDELGIAQADLELSLPRPAVSRARRPWRCVLVTGGTGQLGSQLMAAVLTDPELHVLSLCRGDAQRAHARSVRALTPDEAARVEVVLGDLCAPRFGLAPTAFAALAARVDAIFHLAADTRLAVPYSAVRELNVLGTQRVIELACAGQASELHYVSSISTRFPSLAADGGSVDERPALAPARLPTGYSQSKAVSEQLVSRAGQSGLKVGIYRPSRIWPALTSTSDDLLVRLLRGCVELGVFPDCDLRDNLVSTDVVARTIVSIARADDVTQSVFHIVNPHDTTLAALLEALRACGHTLSPISPDSFLQRMPQSPWLAPLQQLVSCTGMLTTPLPVFDWRNTRDIIPDYECPLLDADQLAASVQRWLDGSAISPPKQSVAPA